MHSRQRTLPTGVYTIVCSFLLQRGKCRSYGVRIDRLSLGRVSGSHCHQCGMRKEEKKGSSRNADETKSAPSECGSRETGTSRNHKKCDLFVVDRQWQTMFDTRAWLSDLLVPLCS